MATAGVKPSVNEPNSRMGMIWGIEPETINEIGGYTMGSFEDLLRIRRSVRNFKETPVPQETLWALIQDSTLAPSSGNEQPWRFVIVTDKCFMTEISRECKQALLHRIDSNPDDYAKKYKTLLSRPEYNIFYNAPALVFILGLKHLKNSEVNCTLAAGYFMFSAANRGLGTCWISFAKFINDKTIKKKLGLDPSLFIVAPIIVGYPQQIPAPPPRRDAEILSISNPLSKGARLPV